MTWFNPTDRGYHNCHLPQNEDGRAGDYWRCEVCDEIWELRCKMFEEGTYFGRVTGWSIRRRFRNLGWTKESNEDATDSFCTEFGD